jgi:NDP-sugar pyrophosphorylase family protein
MQVVIPMSGRGERYRRAGYAEIKPLIPVDGRPMIEHVLGMFPGTHRTLCICAQDHLQTTPLASVIKGLRPDAEIVGIEPHKQGPVHAVLAARDQIADDEPVLISYCDFTTSWSFSDFKRHVAKTRCAGAITAYRGFHPHSMGPNLYAYMRERDGMLLEIREKGCFTDDRMHEYASAGSYYFASGALMKRTFARAVELGLATNGEFYCSTPYNLLVQDGLPVSIYELDDFVQLGTPEDLREYQRWSDFFARSSRFRPELPIQSGATLVPAAGDGRRFRVRGYLPPKPLIEIGGRAMLERSLSTLPASEQCVLLARADVLDAPELQRMPGVSAIQAVLVESSTEGQASTCLLAEDRIDRSSPLLIAPCDASTVFEPKRWAELVQEPTVDCVVWCFRDHPHANRNPKQYGWVETNAAGRVQSVSCKRALHDDVRDDLGIIGIFWFRRAQAFFDLARRLVAENRRVNGEFYVDSVLQLAVEQGLDVRAFKVEHYTCFGTPDDVMTYEYWRKHFAVGA